MLKRKRLGVQGSRGGGMRMFDNSESFDAHMKGVHKRYG